MRPRHFLFFSCVTLAACDSTKPDPVPATVTVALGASTLDPGDSTQATVTAVDAAGKAVSTANATFATSSAGIAQVTTSGRVKAIADGSASVTATVRGVSGSAPITVYTSVAAVGVSSPRSSIEADDTTRLFTTVTSAKNVAITGRTITYSSSNTGVATVSSAGLVQGVSPGSADITATVEGKSGKLVVTIQSKTASLRASADSVRLAVQGSANLTADPLDGSGAVLAGKTVTWSVLDATRASVVSTGPTSATVNWMGPGPTRVIAAVGAARDTVKISAAGDFVVTGGSFTQGVQDAAGTIPMIAGRLPAVLHVLMTSAAPTAAVSKVVLRVTDATGALVFADTEPVLNPLGPTSNGPAARFVIPASHLLSGRKWQVTRDPMGEAPDDDATNDVFPRAAPAAISIVTVPALNVRFVPIVLASHSNSAPTITDSDLPGYLRTLLSTVPLGQVNATIGASFTTSGNFGTAPTGGNASTFWSPLLSELDAARAASADPSIHWYGVVAPPAQFNFVTTGGIAYVRSTDYATYTGAGSRTALGVRTGWFSNQTQARDLVAHELSHNFGRTHTPCGGPTGQDPNYPQADGRIGVTMHDVFAFASGLTSFVADVSATTGDIMGYCNPSWSSTYIYKNTLTSRTSTAVAIVPRQPRVREPLLIVQGSIARDGTPSLIPPVSLVGYQSDAPDGAYRLQLLGATGDVLLERRFEPAMIDHADERHFTIAVPMSDAIAGTQRIRVVGPDKSAQMTLSTSSAPPDARANTGGVTAACGDATTRVAIQDAVTGDVVGIGRGSLTVRSPSGTLLDVRCAGARPRRVQLRAR